MIAISASEFVSEPVSSNPYAIVHVLKWVIPLSIVGVVVYKATRPKHTPNRRRSRRRR